MSRIAIIGTGMAGFGAACQLQAEGVSFLQFDKKPHLGGHTASHLYESGFVFDDGPHVSFTENDRIQRIFAASVNHEYETIRAKVNNYWRGCWIKHPVQCNLYGLPTDLVVDVLRDFIEVGHKEHQEVRSYRDWLIASYGRTFAETFPMEYCLKYHTTPASNLTTDWLGPRLYRPDLEEILRGALSPDTPDVHYVHEFRYPTRGGFASYLSAFPLQPELRLDHDLAGVDPRTRELRFQNEVRIPYEHLISSVPLPELIPMIDGVPSDVIEAAGKLASTSCVLVNLGVDRQDISETHWSYFYDEDFCFSRLSFPHMFSQNNAPPGTGSIQAEIYFSDKYLPLDRSAGEWIEPVLKGLRTCGLLQEDDDILFSDARLVPFANVIFDLERMEALRIVHGYLDDLGIAYCGRYGEWGYLWTDESFVSGENAAQTVLERLGPRRGGQQRERARS